jgi:hypothetical protein
MTPVPSGVLSVDPDDNETLMDPVELESLAAELAGTGAVFIRVPFEQPDNCSECDDDAPLPSLLVVEYRRYGHVYREPVCGRCCAGQKIRALRSSVAVPDYVHVLVIDQHGQDTPTMTPNEAQYRELARTVAWQVDAIAQGTVIGPVYTAVRRLQDNVSTLVAWTPDDRTP